MPSPKTMLQSALQVLAFSSFSPSGLRRIVGGPPLSQRTATRNGLNTSAPMVSVGAVPTTALPLLETPDGVAPRMVSSDKGNNPWTPSVTRSHGETSVLSSATPATYSRLRETAVSLERFRTAPGSTCQPVARCQISV